MADAAVGFMLNNLKELFVYNFHLFPDKDEFNSLREKLEQVTAFVQRATRSRDHAVEIFLKRIRTDVSKAEANLDMYVYETSVHEARNPVTNTIHLPDHTITLRSIGKEMESLIKKFDAYNDKLFASDILSKPETFIRSPPCVEEDNVVGFDEEAAKVVGLLKAKTEDLEVISVVGMAGLGKTTLANKVYNDSFVPYEFSIRSWVYVSQDYDRKQVFLKILFDITRQKSNASDCNVEIIAEELRTQLKEGRYLIVLDDVWTKQAWDDLKTVFPNTKNKSRILLTSRNNDVAIHAGINLSPFQLKFLTEDESWELLEKKVFPRGTSCSKELESLGKQIARKCFGLPLAIVVIAGILKKKDKTPSSWEKVAEKVNTYVAMESKQCMEVLALSYSHLPYDLKPCFLYLGVFPEDFEIPVWKLIHLWIAEGFVQPFGDASAEEMAELNLHNLVDRNLVLVEKRRANGGIKTCRIHDMLRELCVMQAKEENFFNEIKRSSERSYNTSHDLNVSRRVSVHSGVPHYISSKADHHCHLRSLLCYGKEETGSGFDLKTIFPGSFKLPFVLDVLPISFTRFPSIQKFLLLRYIALQGTFNVLPEAISKLSNLQTLIVETKSRNIDVKADLWKWLQYRHVYTNAAIELSSKSKEAVKDPLVNENLRTMSKVSPNSCTDVILSRTPNLQKLGVRGNLALLLDNKNGKFNIITTLIYLEKLKLLHDTYPNPPSKSCALPEWNNFPPKLKKLTLSNTMLDWEEMSVLGKLPRLEVLKLGDNAFVGAKWVTPDGNFDQLRVLQIGKTDLVHWEAAGHQFPQLRRVSLKNCEQLDKIPSGLGDISTLEVMELSHTSRKVVASARLIQKNFKVLVFPPDHDAQP